MNSTPLLAPAFRELVKQAIGLADAREEARKTGDTGNMHHFDRQLRDLVRNASKEDQDKLLAVVIQGTVSDAKPQDFSQDARGGIASGENLLREVVGPVQAGDNLRRGIDKLVGKKTP